MRLFLDTGATLTLFSQDAAQRAGVARDSTLHMITRGVGGQAPSYAGTVGRLDIAGLRATDVPVVVLEQTKMIGKVDGFLGADILSKYDLDIDLPEHRFALYAPRNCPAGGPNWTVPPTRLPRRASGDALPANFFDATLNGASVNAILDTGAAFTVVHRSTALRLGVTSEQLAADKASAGQGVVPGTVAVPRHRFGRLVIGQETFENPILHVAELGSVDSNQIELLLGGEYLRKHRVWISYASNTMYEAPLAP